MSAKTTLLHLILHSTALCTTGTPLLKRFELCCHLVNSSKLFEIDSVVVLRQHRIWVCQPRNGFPALFVCLSRCLGGCSALLGKQVSTFILVWLEFLHVSHTQRRVCVCVCIELTVWMSLYKIVAWADVPALRLRSHEDVSCTLWRLRWCRTSYPRMSSPWSCTSTNRKHKLVVAPCCSHTHQVMTNTALPEEHPQRPPTPP